MTKSRTQRKPFLRRALGTALPLLLGGAVGLGIGWYAGQAGLFDQSPSTQLFALAGFVLGLLALLFVTIIIHEAGHLVFGLLSGYRFSSFRVGSWMWVKENGRLRFKRLSLAGTGGQCLMTPPELVDGRVPVVLYNLGGALMNLLSVPVFLGLHLLWRDSPILSMLMLLGAVLGLASALLNGIPLKTRLVNNDGHNAIALRGNPEALHAFWLQLTINARLSEGERLRQMPQAWFVPPSDESMQNSIIAAIGAIACNRLMDEHRFQEADSLMAHVLTIPSAMVALHRSLLMCDRMYCELIGENRQEVLADMRTKALQKFMKSMGRFLSVVRTQYAVALLADNDTKQAAFWKKRFDKVAAAYPYPGEAEAEGELMAITDARAQA